MTKGFRPYAAAAELAKDLDHWAAIGSESRVQAREQFAEHLERAFEAGRRSNIPQRHPPPRSGRASLTARQLECFDIICAHIDHKGHPPTFREIGAQMGIRSTNGVTDHIKALEKKGYVEREDLKARSLRPIRSERLTDTLRMLGDPRCSVLQVLSICAQVAMGRRGIGRETVQTAVRVAAAYLHDRALTEEDFGCGSKTVE